MTAIIYFYIFIIGTAIGSFLNVLIDRLPEGESILGRSHCDYCRRTLGPLDLIPVLSFIWQGGKCRYCRKKISLYYPIVEIITGLAFVFVFYNLIGSDPLEGPTLERVGPLIGTLGIVSSLIVIFFADLKYHIIPDEATVALVLFSLPGAIANWSFLTSPLQSPIIGGVVVMLTIFFLYFVTGGKGMGFGDVKLGFAMGFLLGFKAGLTALYLAFLLGGVISVILIVLGLKTIKSKIAFGPFLVIGIVIMMFAQEYVFELSRVLFNF